ncbi:phosphate transport system regulatory protein PhoU, partial [Mycobacterium sp. ITM-2017-0098]
FADHAVEVARRVIFQVTGRTGDEVDLPASR